MAKDNKELIKKFQEQGCKLIPLQDKEKKPKSKKVNGSWKWKDVEWLDDELLAASRLGIDHEASNVIDVDIDAKDGTQFIDLLPETLTIGKDVEGRTVSTHKLYRYELGKTESYGKNTDDGCVIEILSKTQTHVIGDRKITHDVPIKKISDSEYQSIRENVKKIYALTVLSRYYPKGGSRDEYIMRIAGTLARECKHWTEYEKEKFIERLCIANNDVEEIRNRVKKVRYQEEQLKLGNEVHGVKSLCKYLKLRELLCIDAIKPEKQKAKGITAMPLNEFFQKNYPPVEYVKFPLLATETITQVWSRPGVGKTWFALEAAGSICNGEEDFLKYKTNAKNKNYPVLYVEGEMRASSLMDRITSITQRYYDQQKKFNSNLFYIAPLVEQIGQNFHPLNEEIGRENVEIKAEQIYKKHNVKPFIFLDNISCLTSIQEKDGVEWISFMNWLVKLRARGYSVVFLHHATKEGSTSSGSNMKERAVDVEIKLELPDPKEKVDGQDGAQFKVSFPKWREYGNSAWATPFIACLNRHHCTWSIHTVMKQKAREVKEALAKGGIDEAMKVTGLSQAQVYRYNKEVRAEAKKLNKNSVNRKVGKVSARVKLHNRQEAEKIVAARHKEKEKNNEEKKSN